jgi:hypothetical protein
MDSQALATTLHTVVDALEADMAALFSCAECVATGHSDDPLLLRAIRTLGIARKLIVEQEEELFLLNRLQET